MAEIGKALLFTNEYPPNVYGGAGVHVEYLSRALARRIAVEVRCFGDQRSEDAKLTVRGYPAWAAAREDTDPRFAGALDAFHRSLAMAKDRVDADVVHCHTWYTDMGGLLAAKLWGVPYVLSIHSLEPLRPWKVEQLGNAYHLSSWMERTAIEQADAIIAVSKETRDDVLRLFAIEPARVHVIHNGIDPEEYRPTGASEALVRHGIDPARPYVLFVGRITRQKGIIHLVDALPRSIRGCRSCSRPAPPTRPRSAARWRPGSPRSAPRGRGDLGARDAAAGGCDPALRACGGLLLPLGLRAVRDHQPRGHGLRDRGGRLAGRRHPGGGGAGGDRPPGRSGARARDLRAGRPRRLLRGPRGRDQPARPRPRAARRDGQARPPAGARPLQLGCDRGDHARPLPRAR